MFFVGGGGGWTCKARTKVWSVFANTTWGDQRVGFKRDPPCLSACRVVLGFVIDDTEWKCSGLSMHCRNVVAMGFVSGAGTVQRNSLSYKVSSKAPLRREYHFWIASLTGPSSRLLTVELSCFPETAQLLSMKMAGPLDRKDINRNLLTGHHPGRTIKRDCQTISRKCPLLDCIAG